ncbi:EcsC family protein [Alicyclobacillus sp. ALC3]|uniref:EcsC family protein n=1 Tax=Alicyclobacillus sp. ALC3 TaxID=2796143 RepID=UPI0023793FA7|nr:EcsC family protein [Alicyclobacillus sp. ALC3]
MSTLDLERLAEAVDLLEHPTLGDKLSRLVGRPVDKALHMIPKRLQRGIDSATDRAVRSALDVVLRSVDMTKVGKPSADKTHKVLAAGAGFAGGLAGGWGVLFELPFSTGIMLRSIADIARSEGEDLSLPAARLACIEVLALDTTHPLASVDDSWTASVGGQSTTRAASNRASHADGSRASLGAYYGLRRALDSAVAEAVAYLAGQAGSVTVAEVAAAGAAAAAGSTAGSMGRAISGAAGAGLAGVAGAATDKGLQATSGKAAPALVHLAQRIAERYGLTVSEQVAAQLIPFIGGLGGATVNFIFTDHFQRVAHGHFIVRRLERSYGAEVVAREYQRIRRGGEPVFSVGAIAAAGAGEPGDVAEVAALPSARELAEVVVVDGGSEWSVRDPS